MEGPKGRVTSAGGVQHVLEISVEPWITRPVRVCTVIFSALALLARERTAHSRTSCVRHLDFVPSSLLMR